MLTLPIEALLMPILSSSQLHFQLPGCDDCCVLLRMMAKPVRFVELLKEKMLLSHHKTPPPRRFLPPQQQRSDRSHAKPRPQSSLKDELQRVTGATNEHTLRGDAQDEFAVPSRPPARQRKVHVTSAQPISHQLPSIDEVLKATTTSIEKDVASVEPQQHDATTTAKFVQDDDRSPASISDRQQFDLPISPKRRKFEHQKTPAKSDAHEMLPPSSKLFVKSISKASPAPKRFLYTSPQAQSQEQAAPPVSLFRQPDLKTGTADSAPLPEAFSPRRRHARYVPGGMASTVQQWILETSQTAIHARKTQSAGSADEVFVMQVDVKNQVLPSKSDHLRLLSGRLPRDGKEVKLALISDVSTQAIGTEQSTSAFTIGIRAPCWTLLRGSEEWLVCVDWKIIPLQESHKA
ncbi:hypothetical protein MRB53_039848 [Persea americana]|nr:hypothetical protein MRB53_039848 [Persea americana]